MTAPAETEVRPDDVTQAETADTVTGDEAPTTDAVTEELADEATTAAPAAAPAEQYRTFTDRPFAHLGEATSDNRVMAPDGDFTFRECPQPLQWCKTNEGGHMSSFTVGVIEKMHKKDNKILGSGYMLNTPEADEAANLVGHSVAKPSIDLAGSEWHFADEKGKKIEDSSELLDRLENNKPLYRHITKGEVVGTTLVPMPAFGNTDLKLNEERESRSPALVASAAEDFRPRIYNHEMFEDPKLTGPTVATMGEDGRIYGHLAVFGQCHRSIQSECVIVPRSPSGYAHFHTSPGVRLDNGLRLPVGRLTVGTGHANPRLRPAPAAAHYDDTGHCFALVRVGEDAHGVWFSGVAAPWATPEQVEAGLSAPLSGDWRDFGQGLDLIAALSVNTPGFAVQGRDDDEGRPVALVASVGPSARGTRGVSLSDIKAAIREVFTEMKFGTEQAVDQSIEEVAQPPAVTESQDAGEQTAPPTTEKTPNEQAAELLAARGA